jgi:hypothetical protein
MKNGKTIFVYKQNSRKKTHKNKREKKLHAGFTGGRSIRPELALVKWYTKDREVYHESSG